MSKDFSTGLIGIVERSLAMSIFYVELRFFGQPKVQEASNIINF